MQRYSEVHIGIGKPGDTEGAAGSSYVTVPSCFTARRTAPSAGAAEVTLRRVNDVRARPTRSGAGTSNGSTGRRRPRSRSALRRASFLVFGDRCARRVGQLCRIAVALSSAARASEIIGEPDDPAAQIRAIHRLLKIVLVRIGIMRAIVARAA